MGFADGSSTLQNMVKLVKPQSSDKVMIGVSGPVGLAQKIMAVLEPNWQELTGRKMDMLRAKGMIRDRMWTQVEPEIEHAAVAKKIIGPGALKSSYAHTLIALPVDTSPTLLIVDQQCGTEEVTFDVPFVSIGSGRLQADPFLTFWKKHVWGDRAPKLASDAALGAIVTLDHVIRAHPDGGVGGEITAAQLRRSDDDSDWIAEFMPKEAVDFHRINYTEALGKMRAHLDPDTVSE